MSWTTLIQPSELAAHLERSNWRIFDCRFDLLDPEAGERAWREGHLAGAHYLHLENDLSGSVGRRTGRHPLPEPAHLRARLASFGVDPTTQIVCYDANTGAFAARLWWLVRWLGHERVAVLDGGIDAWRHLGYPTTIELPETPATAEGPARATATAETVDAHALAADTGWAIVDARAPGRFRGEEEPIDPIAGHIPSALNRPFAANLDASGFWRTPADLQASWLELLGATNPQRVVHMCGSGVTAAHNQLAMEHAGLHGSKLYPGSWSHWITDPDRPIERG